MLRALCCTLMDFMSICVNNNKHLSKGKLRGRQVGVNGQMYSLKWAHFLPLTLSFAVFTHGADCDKHHSTAVDKTRSFQESAL